MDGKNGFKYLLMCIFSEPGLLCERELLSVPRHLFSTAGHINTEESKHLEDQCEQHHWPVLNRLLITGRTR